MSLRSAHRDPKALSSPLHGKIVPPCGPTDSPVLVIGERPGYVEANIGKPFVGPTGKLQASYFHAGKLHVSRFRLANIVWDFNDHNADPTSDDIARWESKVLVESRDSRRKVIVAVGRFAMRWFLGDDADLATSRGLPHYAGAFDPTRANRTRKGVIVVPVTHPAAGLRNVEMRAQSMDDYARACDIITRVLAGDKVSPREDEFAGRERYEDVTGAQLADIIWTALQEKDWYGEEIALDTEGSVEHPWSVQVSLWPGTGFTLRVSQPDFAEGIDALQKLANGGTTFILHQAHSPDGCCHDFKICRAMGLELSRARIYDTMFAAGLLRLEPRGLKALAYRYCGMDMVPYQSLMEGFARDRQRDYLCDVVTRADEWPKPEERVEWGNDGVGRAYKPKAIAKIAESVIVDMVDPAKNNEQKQVDPYKRWMDTDYVQREAVEKVLGAMPRWATLDDIDLADAIRYASRDPDATLRVVHALRAELERMGLTDTMRQSMGALPVFEDMERNGMPVSPPLLQTLHDELDRDIDKLGRTISKQFYGGRPFNPKSTKNVTSMMLRRSLEGAELTKGGRISTGKKSIEHLRHTDEAMAAIIEWREKQHVRDMYCVPTLNKLKATGQTADIVLVHTKLNPFGTTTRRLASNDPNLMAYPKHEKPGGMDYGQRLRDCFVAPKGWLFLECDLSQAEARMLAHESEDPLLIRLFVEERDIHTETASRIFGVKPEDVTKIQRFLAKRATFGIAYGVSGMGLATQLRTMPGIDTSEWGEDRCTEIINEWLKLYNGCNDYFNSVRKETKRTGMVRDCWGMIRYLPTVWSDKEGEVQAAYREAINHRIQGGAQGCLQNSIGWLRPHIAALNDAGIGAKWGLTIHDSLLFVVEKEHVDTVEAVVLEGMTKHCGLQMRVPWNADAKHAASWGGL